MKQLFLIGSLLFICNSQSMADSIKKGRLLAEKVCAGCHVVPSGNKFGGIGSSISFLGLRGLPDWRERFRTFFARRPHAAFVEIKGVTPKKNPIAYARKITLQKSDIQDLLQYAETLVSQ